MEPRISIWQWIKCTLFYAHKWEGWHYRNVRSDAPYALDTKIPIKNSSQVRTRICASCGRTEMRRL